jgi:hypothetical protein
MLISLLQQLSELTKKKFPTDHPNIDIDDPSIKTKNRGRLHKDMSQNGVLFFSEILGTSSIQL